MTEIVLHHYATSPFSEKVRRILAYKKIPWRAVEQPLTAPKPQLTPLTGGYRRIPVMQVGADIYCDTALIVRRIEALHHSPPVIPAPLAGAVAMIEDWADHRLFMQVVPPTLVGLLDALPPDFIDDRAAMSPAFTREGILGAAPHALAQTRHSLDYLDQQLGHTAFLLGDAFTLADAACFHPVWFLLKNPALAPELDARKALKEWVERIEGFGPDSVEPLGDADALALARAAAPADIAGDSVDCADYAAGDDVVIVADDYGQETTHGRVVRVLANEITVLREDDQVGEVAIHYPRAGYRISRQ